MAREWCERQLEYREVYMHLLHSNIMLPKLTSKELLMLKSQFIGEVGISLDLGLSRTSVTMRKEDVLFPDGQTLKKSDIGRIKENVVYFVEDNQLKQVALFSEETNLHYKLLPTKDWPTITFSSTPMHRHRHMTPREDTELKIEEIAPVTGRVLDTCCGLGYTAIVAARAGATEVHTYDRDRNVQVVATYNPYSQELFTNKKITLHHEDIEEAIATMRGNMYDRIIHDPPTLAYAPNLYSAPFHKELYRVLKKGGILWHYCSQPQKTQGRLLYPRILKQLREAGFSEVVWHERSSGVFAIK